MAKILVTGATGLIGRHLLDALRAQGHQVRAQYRSRPGARTDVAWTHWDMTAETDLGALVSGCDAVIHLAAELAQPSDMHRVNVEATMALAREAAAQNVRCFVHASSIVVYGSPKQPVIDENSALIDPDLPIEAQYQAEPYLREYARTKALAELRLANLALAMTTIVIRPAVVADRQKFLEALSWGASRKWLSRHRRTQYVSVFDVAAAIVHLMERGLAEGSRAIEAYNLSDGEGGTFGELLADIGPEHHRDRLPWLRVPAAIEHVKNMIKHRMTGVGQPLGLLRISSAKLAGTGFEMPVGYRRAIDLARAGRDEP